MVSVERVTAYGKLESERKLETFPKTKAPPIEWPERGEIKLHNVNFKYAMNYSYVLKSVSLKIHSYDKVSCHCDNYVHVRKINAILKLDWHCG